MTQNSAQHANISLSCGGDISGSLSNISVAKIQGNAIKNITPTDTYLLQWVAADSEWEPIAQNSSPTVGPAIENISVTTSGGLYPSITDVVIIVAVGGASLVSLPAAAPIGRLLFLGNNTGGNITITPHAGTTINGSSSSLTRSGGSILTCYDGTNWVECGFHA